MKQTTAMTLLGLACLMAIPSIARAEYRDGMNLYEYVGSNPVVNVDPMGLAKQKFKCCIDAKGKRVPLCDGGTLVSNEDIHEEIAVGVRGFQILFRDKDITDFGRDVYMQKTYTSFTGKKIAETNIKKQRASVLAKVREGVIDCFCDEDYFDVYLKQKHEAKSPFRDVVILARGVYSETTQWDFMISTKILLASVIKNRKNLPNFPNTYIGVLSQKAQFSGWPAKAAKYNQMRGKRQKFNWAISYAAAVTADGAKHDPSNGADHFYSPYIVTPLWAKGATPVKPKLPVDYLRNVRHGGKFYHGASFLFLDLIDEKGHWR